MNLSIFNSTQLFEASTNLFNQLGIKLNSNTREQLPIRDLLGDFFRETEIFAAIAKAYFIGIIDDSVFRATGLFDESYSYKNALQLADKSYEGLMFFALELSKQPTRAEISELTRAFNRISHKMPVALLLKYNAYLSPEAIISIAISERFKYKQNWRQGEKAGKVIILRDIHTDTTHAGHERILLDLVKPVGINNYDQLHQHWLQVLDVNILNKKFFQELANWYFWAMENVQFPDDLEKKKDLRNATNLIRLITRLIFIWFIKEKKLVPANLFRKDSLVKILKDFSWDEQSGNYYNAILQNLFFGTLNQRMADRGFVEIHGGFKKGDQGVRNLYRYPDKFSIEVKEIEKLFKEIPFLNGGLFDCLDKTDEETKKDYFVDGFTRRKEKQAIVPDVLFFGEEREVDLTKYYNPDAKKLIIKKVKGLVLLLESYKFTVAENTPIEEEIALDPELLGKVFENLLASYNPETQTTARKQTGSFYTPREIVNYMVDESLMEYLKQKCNDFPDLENRLRDLFSYSENENPFNEKETKILIQAINNCKLLDPACGSGAFPMGVLHKMVHLLTKLDADNTKWKARQKEKIIGEQIKELEKDKIAIKGLSDKAVREKAEQAVDERLKEVDEIFNREYNFDDYSRKLFLIENCIYGVDIQPIAVQISKLRFFISLIIDQNKQEGKENMGIRSLPNLETKFVAANTLIGLEIPTTDLFSENNPIKDLQEELKEVRHLYFNAKTRKVKLQYQSRDKQLRKEMSEKIKTLLVERNEEEIAKILIDIEEAILKLQKIEQQPENIEIHETINLFGEKEYKRIDKRQEKIKAQKEFIKQLENNLRIKQNGLNKDAVLHVAENIASFDPYDQNHFANWFEPEWMFGKELEKGFDIVIGNPPYVNVENLELSTKKYLFEHFETCKGRTDIYIAFIEKTMYLLKQNGVFSYIIPYSFTNQNYGSLSRKMLIDKYFVREILDTSEYYVFETAIVKNVILSVVNCKNKETTSIRIAKSETNFFDNSFIVKNINQNLFLGLKDYRFETKDITSSLNLKSKIWKDSLRLDEICLIAYGARINHKTENIGKENYIHQNFNKGFKPFIEGKNIDRYSYTQFGWLDYKPDEHYNSMFTELFENEKIFFINVVKDRLRFAFDKQNFYNSHTVINCVKWDLLKKATHVSVRRNLTKEKIQRAIEFNYLFLLGILNSNIINWYFLNFLSESLHFYPDDAKELPIPNIVSTYQEPFITIVDKILSSKAANSKADTSVLEKQLDEMVYKLYELTDDEIAIIEGGSHGK